MGTKNIKQLLHSLSASDLVEVGKVFLKKYQETQTQEVKKISQNDAALYDHLSEHQLHIISKEGHQWLI